jgi:putative transcriptional regulator
MENEMFQGLLVGVRQMKAHMRGEEIKGARVTEIAEPEASAIRETVGISQAEFARLIGVPVKTVQNWEQHRTRPTGPARTLLRIFAADPVATIKALHG